MAAAPSFSSYDEQVSTAHIDLVGLREIATRTGVPIDQVNTWTHRPDFPEPTADLDVGTIWVWGPVRKWLLDERIPGDADLPH